MGGHQWEARDKGKYFSQALLRYYRDTANIAFCMFAQPKNEWQRIMSGNMAMIQGFCEGKTINFKLLNEDNFTEVSQWADIVYIPGGDPFLLKKKLEEVENIANIWDKKVIAGSSAGAFVLCEQFVYLQERRFGQGFGWIGVSCIAHWRDEFEDYAQKDWDWAEQESLKRFPSLPVLTVPEGEFVEFSVN